MACTKPLLDIRAKALRQGRHLVRLLIRNRADPVVGADVAFLSESVELLHGRRIKAKRVGEGLEGAKVMRFALCRAVPTRRQGCRRAAQRGIVGDVQPPHGTQAGRPAVHQVLVRRRQKFGDLLAARPMGFQQAVGLPLLQGHLRLPPATPSVP